MTTQELKNKIEKVLGNNIRCLLPSYWWKNLFHSVADRIDEVETTVTENVNDMVVKSLREFEAKHPDIVSRTFVYTEDANSAEARKNSSILHKWVLDMGTSTAGTKINPLYIAVPIMPTTFRIEGYSILSPTHRFNSSKYGVEFLDVPMDDGQIYNISFSITGNGEATRELASSSSGGGSVMFVVDPLGNLTEEQKQNNADAFLKVLEAEGAIDINIMVMIYIAKPNMISVDNNGNLVLVVAGVDGGVTKFIISPEGDATIETVEPTSSGGVEIRELRINSNLSDEEKAYNIETVQKYKEGKAVVVTEVLSRIITSTGTASRMQSPFFVDLYEDENSTKLATLRFVSYNMDMDGVNNVSVPNGLFTADVTIYTDGSVYVEAGRFYDNAMSDTSLNAVQNMVVKKYIDDALANVGGGGGGNIVVDTEMSSTSTNPVQNKVVYSELQKKQDTISDLADIRSGAALGKTALQSVPSEYVTESELTEKGYATTSQVNDKQDRIDDLEAIRSGAAKGATALQSEQYKGTVTGVKINGTTKNPSSGIVDLGTVITAHQDISHLATKEELNSLTNEIISNERVHAASLVDIDARIQDILTRLNNAGL